MERKIIISFCGHSKIIGKPKLEEKVLDAIKNIANSKPAIFYLGEYGDFDYIARNSAVKYKAEHPSSELIFVTPYLDKKYIENKKPLYIEFDEILFPDIENCLPKFAIIARNKWMIKNSDHLIAYVNHNWGGASKSLSYAISLRKNITNLSH